MAKQIQIDILANDRTKQAFNSVKRNTEGTKQSLLSLKNVLVAVAGSVVIKQFLDLSNTFQSLQNRLKLVTSSTQELAFVQQELFDISQRTRGGFAETVELYQKLALQSKSLGLQSSQLAQITENVNKVIGIAGVGAVQASSGILQLSQAFASGRLQGDEFRSISENIPPLLDIFAKQLGVTRGELKKLGSEGKITSDVIAKALLAETENINEAFSKLSPTIGQASTVVGNSLLNLVGKFNEVTGASDLFAQSLIKVSGFLDELTKSIDLMSIDIVGLEKAFAESPDEIKKILPTLGSVEQALVLINIAQESTIFGVQTLKDEYIDLEKFLEKYKLTLEETTDSQEEFVSTFDVNKVLENVEALIKQRQQLAFLSKGFITANTELGRFGQTMKDNSSIIDEINTDHFPVFNRTILEATNFLGRFDEFSARTFNNFADYLTDSVMTGKASFKDFARSVIRDLASIIIKQQLAIATQRLFGNQRLFGESAGISGVLGTVGGAISGIFGRANGGTVQANKPYLIGERGAELFVPNTNGTVVPNNQMKSSGTNVNITINTVDARGIDELLTDRRSTIVNLINDALNSQGREALV
jgi:tape measure domain-containing protein